MNAFIRDGAPRRRKRRTNRKTDRSDEKKRKTDLAERPSSSSTTGRHASPVAGDMRHRDGHRTDRRHDSATRRNDDADPMPPSECCEYIDLTTADDEVCASGQDVAGGSSSDQQPSVHTDCEDDLSYPADFILATQTLLDDFKKIDSARVNDTLQDYLQRFDENKKKQMLTNMLKQCYEVSGGSLNKSMQMMQQVQNKATTIIVNQKSIISSTKKSPLKCKLKDTLDMRINKKIIKLFGKEFLESDDKILSRLPIGNFSRKSNIIDFDSINVESEILEDKKNIIDLDEFNDTCSLTNNFSGLIIPPQVTVGRSDVTHSITEKKDGDSEVTDGGISVVNHSKLLPTTNDNTSIQSNSHFRNESNSNTSSKKSHLIEEPENKNSDSDIIKFIIFKNIEIENTSDAEKLKYDQIVEKIKIEICKIVKPNNAMYEDITLKNLVTYFSNGNFLYEFDSSWESIESNLIGELIVKLFETFNKTEENMTNLSGCLIFVFRGIITNSSYPPCEIKRHLILFLDCIKKYAKYYDSCFWKNWFASKLFLDWFFILASFFTKNLNITSLRDKSIWQNAMLYLEKMKKYKYIFKNCFTNKIKPSSGIFELTNSEDLLDIDSVSSENVSEAADISVDETVVEAPSVPKIPIITVRSEFSFSNSFKNDFCGVKVNDEKSEESEPNINDTNIVQNNNLSISSDCIEAENPNGIQKNPSIDVNDANQSTIKINSIDANAQKNGTKRKDTELSSQNISSDCIEAENPNRIQKNPSIDVNDANQSTVKINSIDANAQKNGTKRKDTELSSQNISSDCIEAEHPNGIQKNPSIDVNDANQSTVKINSIDANAQKNGTKRKDTELSSQNVYYTIGNNPQKYSIACCPLPNCEQTRLSRPTDVPGPSNNSSTEPANVTSIRLPNETIVRPSNVTETPISCAEKTLPANAVNMPFPFGVKTVSLNATNIQPSHSMNTSQTLSPTGIQPSYSSDSPPTSNATSAPSSCPDDKSKPTKRKKTQNVSAEKAKRPYVKKTWPVNNLNARPSITTNPQNHPVGMNSQFSALDALGAMVQGELNACSAVAQPTYTTNSQRVLLPACTNTRPSGAVNCQMSNMINAQYSAMANSPAAHAANTRHTGGAVNCRNPNTTNAQCAAMVNCPFANVRNTGPAGAVQNYRNPNLTDAQYAAMVNCPFANVPYTGPAGAVQSYRNPNVTDAQYSAVVNCPTANAVHGQLLRALKAQALQRANGESGVGTTKNVRPPPQHPSGRNAAPRPNAQWPAALNRPTNQPVASSVPPNLPIPNAGHYNNTYNQYYVYNNIVNYPNAVDNNGNAVVVPGPPGPTHCVANQPTAPPASRQSSCSGCPVSTAPCCSRPVRLADTRPPPPPPSYNARPHAAPSYSPKQNHGNPRGSNDCDPSPMSVASHPARTAGAENSQPSHHNSQVSPELPNNQSPNAPSQPNLNKKCWTSECQNTSNYFCKICFIACYCSSKCQKNDWHYHQNECRKPQSENSLDDSNI